MKVTENQNRTLLTLDGAVLSEPERAKLLNLGNGETARELSNLMDEAAALAAPQALFAVSGVESAQNAVTVGGVSIDSKLVREKLQSKSRCFPYIMSCGPALEKWSAQYHGDFLMEFWADEIKKLYLRKMGRALFTYLKETYHTGGHLTALNPGSLEADWSISGQRELFSILGGREYVKETIGVIYTESFLMLPSKSGSGIAFESEVFYENCQFCPRTDCPNRRAKRIEKEEKR